MSQTTFGNASGHRQWFPFSTKMMWNPAQAALRIPPAPPFLPAATCSSGDAAPLRGEEERERVRCPMTAQDAERGCLGEWRRQDAV